MLGMILRSTGKVKRGLGTIRHDINLSIKGMPRVELKGFQDLKSIPKVIEIEIKRQLSAKEHTAEVRKVNPDFTTTFLRPMPGSSRMYPETDHPSIPITKELMNSIKIPELLTEKAIKLEKEFNINSDLALEIIEEEQYFRLLVNRFKNISPSMIIHSIIELPKEVKTRFNYNATSKELEELLDMLNSGRITKDALIKILEDKAVGKTISINEYKPLDESIIKKEIIGMIDKNKQLSANAIMGMVMVKYKGRIEGKKVMDFIQQAMKK